MYIRKKVETEAFVGEVLDDIFTYMDHVIDETEETGKSTSSDL